MTEQRGMQRSHAAGQPGHAYDSTRVRRPRTVQFAGAGAAGIAIQAIEVCQSIQSVDNSVSLIAQKATLVRVFLDQASVTRSARLRGELTLRTRNQGPAAYLPAMNELKLDPSDHATLPDKRETLAASLNFLLPAEATAPGALTIEVNRVTQTGGQDQPLTGNLATVVTFVDAPPLRVRCIGLRYRDTATGRNHTPDATHFAFFRSYLERAYPAPAVIWSQLVVDANFEAPFDDSTVLLANAQIAALRSADVDAGTDPRTHYYGLVDDANGSNFMRGRAMGIPVSPQPDTVASGPCGIPNGFAGDNDMSYADWYGAHELGHTFGRYHPGFPVGQQDASDPYFPYANGQLSNADRQYVGYDLGDPTLGVSMQALRGTHHHDVMTYAPRQWLSAHTFEAIRTRLREEDELYARAEV